MHDYTRGIDFYIKQAKMSAYRTHSPVDAPHYIVQQLKGFTSRRLRQEFSILRTRLTTLWTRSYYCESVGHISEDTIKQYIFDQKKH